MASTLDKVLQTGRAKDGVVLYYALGRSGQPQWLYLRMNDSPLMLVNTDSGEAYIKDDSDSLERLLGVCAEEDWQPILLSDPLMAQRHLNFAPLDLYLFEGVEIADVMTSKPPEVVEPQGAEELPEKFSVWSEPLLELERIEDMRGQQS